MKSTISALAGLLLFCASVWARQPNEDQAAIAYSSGGVLYLANASGKTLTTAKLDHPIGAFALTADAKQVLFAPLGKAPHYYGGQLYLLTLSTNKVERLTHGPYYDKSGKSDEVYSDPDLSPDGRQAIFAVHAQSSGDIVEASGPFATVTLATGSVSVMQSSLHVDANGVAFANDPHWSPDGEHVLLNYEDGADIEDLSKKTSRDLSPLIGNGGWSHALGWLGSECIVYIAGKDYAEAQNQPARFLNLKTQKSGLLSTLLDLTPEQVTGLLAISGSTRVRKQTGHLWVETSSGRWAIPGANESIYVRILPSVQRSHIPEPCQ
jgi:hypothetical protein